MHAFLRPCFEGSVSGELLVRLQTYPKLKELLDKLPPKMLSIASGKPVEEVRVGQSATTRVDLVSKLIRNAKFTGKGDAEKVPTLYQNYVERMVTALMRTLATAIEEEVLSLPDMPLVETFPKAPTLRLAAGQLVLLKQLERGEAKETRENEKEERLGVVGEDGRATLPFLGGQREIAFDAAGDHLCSQVVLPWRSVEASLATVANTHNDPS